MISCLCVTRDRTSLLLRAITCFQNQTYPNRELLILYESDDLATQELGRVNQDPTIRYIEIEATPKKKLGQLRNIAVKQSRGDFFCNWDDDDWYHKDRLFTQYRACVMTHKPASVLLQWLVYDHTTKQAYLSYNRAWEGSLLCRKAVFDKGFHYTLDEKGEDAPLIRKMIRNRLIFPVHIPQLYIYTYHGANTWERSNIEMIIKRSQLLEAPAAEILGGILSGGHAHEEACNQVNDPRLLVQFNYFNYLQMGFVQ